MGLNGMCAVTQGEMCACTEILVITAKYNLDNHTKLSNLFINHHRQRQVTSVGKFRDFLYFLDIYLFLCPLIGFFCPLIGSTLLYSILLYSPYLCISTEEKYLVLGATFLVPAVSGGGSEKSSVVLSDTHCRHCLVQIIVTVSLRHQQ